MLKLPAPNPRVSIQVAVQDIKIPHAARSVELACDSGGVKRVKSPRFLCQYPQNAGAAVSGL